MIRNDQSIYGKYAETWWDDSRRFLRLLANQVHARMACFDRVDTGWDGLRTLDVGCGGGFMAEALACRGARVMGLDPWVNLVRAAKRHARESGLEIAYVGGVGEAIPIGDSTVDRIVCVGVLEHVSDVTEMLFEIRRVLRPGGIFFFGTINRTWLSRLMVITMAEDILRVVPRGVHNADMFIRPEELRAQLTHLGFQVAPMTGIGPVGINRRLDFIIGRVPTTAVAYAGHAVRV